MCYHYSLAKTAREIADRYGINIKRTGINPEPVYYHVNGFNHNSLPSVYKVNRTDDLNMELMQWGLVPSWVKNEEQALKIRSATLNARAETVDSKPSFRGAYSYRPCLIPATGYFEWMHKSTGKTPFFIFIPDMPVFSFAGIWEEWINEHTGEILRSFSIITCDANSLTAKIHNSKRRMPVILDQVTEKKWLNKDKSFRKSLLQPFDPGRMNAYSISKRITDKNRDSNAPETLEPVNYNN
ncbi:MAG: SOS response-associated peptidase [Bacteroidales bacterium]